MKNLVTFVQNRLSHSAIGERIRLDPNGINGEYFDDGDEFPSIGRIYEITKVHLDKEGNPTNIDIEEEGTRKIFEGYGIDNFELCNEQLNRSLGRYLSTD